MTPDQFNTYEDFRLYALHGNYRSDGEKLAELREKLDDAAMRDPYIRKTLAVIMCGMDKETALIQCVLALWETNRKLLDACNKLMAARPTIDHPFTAASSEPTER